MREPGYYWVKWNELGRWDAVFWNGDHWENTDGMFNNELLSEINETRILNPDEVKEKATN